jgi:hypothetical protein
MSRLRWVPKNIDYAPIVSQRTGSEEMVNWSAVLTLATQLRPGGIKCQLGALHFGGVNMIRQVVFDDGVEWIIRIPMVPYNPINDATMQGRDHHWTQQRREEMRCSILTSEYVRTHSDIPVPEVFGFDTECSNVIGPPYVFMECIKGNAITDLGETVPGPFVDKVHAFMARFQVPIFSM